MSWELAFSAEVTAWWAQEMLCWDSTMFYRTLEQKFEIGRFRVRIQILGIISEEDLGAETLQSHMAVAAGAEEWSPSPHGPQPPPLTPSLPAPFVSRVVPASCRVWDSCHPCRVL